MSGLLSWARLSFRLQRLEILILATAVALAAGVMLWAAFELAGLVAAYPACDWYDATGDCRAPASRFVRAYGVAELILGAMWPAAFGLGLVLGVPVVAREVDHGTAQLAWTIGRSRVRWLVGRVAFVVVVGVVLLSVLAVVTEILGAAMRFDIDTSKDFWLHGNRGPLIVGHGVLALGAGVLVGALLGRQLPALLLGAFLVGALYAASAVGFPRWYATEAVVASQNEWLGGPLWIESGIELTSGERVTWGEVYGNGVLAVEMYQAEDGVFYASQADADAGRDPIGRDYALIIPGERYTQIVWRETGVFTAVGALLVGAATFVTARRRPV